MISFKYKTDYFCPQNYPLGDKSFLLDSDCFGFMACKVLKVYIQVLTYVQHAKPYRVKDYNSDSINKLGN